MHMLLARGAIILWAMAATLLPVAAAPAAEAAFGTQSPASDEFLPRAASARAPAARREATPFHLSPLTQTYRLDPLAPDSRPDGLRFDFAWQPVPEPLLRVGPGASALRPGWALSGRAGLLRWLTPIDREGGTTVRLGGRIPDQPRTPGLGNFSLSLHYAFE
jgi:hypothetical protein